MDAASLAQILAELQHPQSRDSQLQTLRSLKNDLVGHDQKKASWIEAGILPTLSQIQAQRIQSGDTFQGDAIIAQVIIIIGSLARGSVAQDGPSFITPILAGTLVTGLLHIFSANDRHPPTLLILETLNAIASRLPFQQPQDWPFENALSTEFFMPEHLNTVASILTQVATTPDEQKMINLTASLVSNLVVSEQHKNQIAEGGVLDALATQVASIVVRDGYVLPGAENHLLEAGLSSFPSPAFEQARLAPLLRAISIVVDQSAARANHFVTSPSLLAVFPRRVFGSAGDETPETYSSSVSRGFGKTRKLIPNPIDELLPQVPIVTSASINGSSFLSSHGQLLYTRSGQPYRPAGLFSGANENSECNDESPLVSWLLLLSRRDMSDTDDTLMTAKLVTILFRLGLAKKDRLYQFGFILIPQLVAGLDKSRADPPAILAGLVMDSTELQKLAVDAGAIKKLAQLLKETYSPVVNKTRPIWNPEKKSDDETMAESDEMKLGPPEILPVVQHLMRFRESVLRALAALAPIKDEYRKAICENGAVPYIIDSLKPTAKSVESSNSEAGIIPGNPVPTLLAACGAARALTRSVSALRTNLIDAGVATPLFELLTNPDLEVQIAATTVFCNLAMDFSPMREAIISAGIIETLCKYAHYPDSRLQKEALWALKNLLTKTSNDIKVQVLDSLGAAWLKNIIREDISALQEFESNRHQGLEPKVAIKDSNTGIARTFDSISMSPRRQNRKVTPSRTNNTTLKLAHEKLEIQEQTISILQNLTCGPSSADMIEIVFDRFGGASELFELILPKLRPRNIASTLPISPFSPDSKSTIATTVQNTSSQQSQQQPLFAPICILSPLILTLVHLAAGSASQKNKLTHHPTLLSSITPFFKHLHPPIRANCAWLVVNLCYEENADDQAGARERGRALAELGVKRILMEVKDGDAELDVKERARGALQSLNRVLGES